MRRSERDIQSGSEKGALSAGKQKELLRVGAALRYAGLQPDVSGAGNDLHHRKQAGGGSFCPASGGDHRDLCHRADGSAAAEGGSAPLFPLRGRRRAAGRTRSSRRARIATLFRSRPNARAAFRASCTMFRHPAPRSSSSRWRRSRQTTRSAS